MKSTMKAAFVAATALAFISIGSARADSPGRYSPVPQEIYHAGAWKVFAGNSNEGNPLCGMAANGKDSLLLIKYFRGDMKLTVQIFDKAWRFSEGAEAWVRGHETHALNPWPKSVAYRRWISGVCL